MPDHLEAVRKASASLRAAENATDKARQKLHDRVRDAWEAGESKSAIARAAGVSRQWIANVVDRVG